MYPANALFHYICGREKIFAAHFSDDLNWLKTGVIG